jgi:hypothetical protein
MTSQTTVLSLDAHWAGCPIALEVSAPFSALQLPASRGFAVGPRKDCHPNNSMPPLLSLCDEQWGIGIDSKNETQLFRTQLKSSALRRLSHHRQRSLLITQPPLSRPMRKHQRHQQSSSRNTGSRQASRQEQTHPQSNHGFAQSSPQILNDSTRKQLTGPTGPPPLRIDTSPGCMKYRKGVKPDNNGVSPLSAPDPTYPTTQPWQGVGNYQQAPDTSPPTSRAETAYLPAHQPCQPVRRQAIRSRRAQNTNPQASRGDPPHFQEPWPRRVERDQEAKQALARLEREAAHPPQTPVILNQGASPAQKRQRWWRGWCLG